jgi:outer membrane protein assembly factor BamB
MRTLLTILGLLAASVALADTPEYLLSDHNANKVLWVDKDGKVVWDYPAQNSTDCSYLPNGHILFANRTGATEVTRDKQVVWQWKAKPGEEVYTCQRLDNGDTLVGELGAARLIEVAPDGVTIHKEIKLPIPVNMPQHPRFRNARKLANGHYLFAIMGNGTVKELDGDGKEVWEATVPGDPFCAVRLPDGHTLVGCADAHTIQELDAAGKVVWEVKQNDVPGARLEFVAGLQRLPNGDTVVANYLGHGSIGHGAHVFEITPDKKLVWKNDEQKAIQAVASCCLIGVEGVVR